MDATDPDSTSPETTSSDSPPFPTPDPMFIGECDGRIVCARPAPDSPDESAPKDSPPDSPPPPPPDPAFAAYLHPYTSCTAYPDYIRRLPNRFSYEFRPYSGNPPWASRHGGKGKGNKG